MVHFFHEIGHVLLHGKTDLWIEGNDPSGQTAKESEANRFASNILIPPTFSNELRRLKSKSSVTDFAQKIGIAPGMVVGCLQHDGIWPQRSGNDLERNVDLANA